MLALGNNARARGIHQIAAGDLRALARRKSASKRSFLAALASLLPARLELGAWAGARSATRNGRASLVQLQRGAAKLFFLFEGKDMQVDGLICLLIGWLQEPITD
jgi:hypothetical protein